MPRNNVLIGSSNNRKYKPILEKLKKDGSCTVKCARRDTVTIINMVKKEKAADKNKDTSKVLKVELTEDGIEFKLVTDTSIRNL